VATTGANAEAPLTRPEYFRLPKSGGDPHFGFSRSFYYAGEQRGWWRLIHIRDDGKDRGITLVPFTAVLNFVRAKEAEAKARFESTPGDNGD
jgi:hypothetical protein